MKTFISYCHADEWLKNEFLAAISSLIKSKKITVWHDRLINPGGVIDKEIDEKLNESELMILMISHDFLASDYCFNIEFKRALERYKDGTMKIVPVIIRDCDFSIDPLNKFNFLPNDAKPVNPEGAKKEDNELRDKNWRSVCSGLRKVISETEALTLIEFNNAYQAFRKADTDIQHSRLGLIDIVDFFQEPEVVYSEDGQVIALNSINELTDCISAGCNLFLAGEDQSGRTSILYYIQNYFINLNIPCVILKGQRLMSNDIHSEVEKEIKRQLKPIKYNKEDIIVLIDDFDECKLPEKRQLRLVENISDNYLSIVYVTYSRVALVPFKKVINTQVYSFAVEPLPANKIYEMVENWCQKEVSSELELEVQKSITDRYKLVQQLLGGGTLPSYIPMIKTFLEVADASSGSDVAITSNAACYDSLITLKLNNLNVPSNRTDLIKSFLGFIAGKNFIEDDVKEFQRERFDELVSEFDDLFFEGISTDLDSVFKAGILVEEGGLITFKDKFLSYFFAGRYLAMHLRVSDVVTYDNFILKSINNIRYRAYANTLLYCIYFSSDVTVLELLVDKLDEKFSFQKPYEITEKSFFELDFKSTMLENLELSNDLRKDRLSAIEQKYDSRKFNTSDDAAAISNPYAPSLKALVSSDASDKNTFIDEMYSLFRLQSVVGSALNTRQGTFFGKTILECTRSIVESAGRFANVNLEMAKTIIANMNDVVDVVMDKFPEEDFSYLVEGSDIYNREINFFVANNIQSLLRVHGQWSILSSNCVAGRILAQKNTFEALNRLSKIEESGDNINYQITEGISKLFYQNKIDRQYYSDVINRSSETSFKVQALGFSIYAYSRFMPIEYDDAQWLTQKFNFKTGIIRTQQRKLTKKHKV